MLKAGGRGVRDGKPVQFVVLGLSHLNLARLKEDRPIIFAGETEQSMARQLADLIGPGTRTRIDPKVSDA